MLREARDARFGSLQVALPSRMPPSWTDALRHPEHQLQSVGFRFEGGRARGERSQEEVYVWETQVPAAVQQ